MKHCLPFFLLPGLTWAQVTPNQPVPFAELLNLAVPLVIIAVFGGLFRAYQRDQKKTLRLMEANYRAALVGTDKIRAYELGFFYYCALRPDNKPTDEDQKKLLRELRLMGLANSIHHTASPTATR